jgi:ribosome-associated protein
MDIRKLQRAIVDGLEDVKAQNIVVFNTEHLSSLFERVIIASGVSNRQTRSLASSVREEVKKAGYPIPRIEGESNGEWIIVDCGAAVVHVMQPVIRDYYNLEELWGGKTVNVKLASNVTKLVKAAELEEPVKKVVTKVGVKASVAAKTAAAKKITSKKVKTEAEPQAMPNSMAIQAPAEKPPVRRVLNAKATNTPTNARLGAVSSAARKVAAKKAPVIPGRVVTRVVGLKSSSAKRPPPAKKVVTRFAATKKVVAKKPVAKKASASKKSTRSA